ncbi:MAG: hypothetical protein WCI43_09935 [Candidatus Firestonebacteria bacterium]
MKTPVLFLLLVCSLSLYGSSYNSARLKLGIGDRFDQVINGKDLVVYEEARKDGLKFKYVAVWLVPGWPAWLTKETLLKISRDGYTPVIIYYTFGDSSSKEYLEKNGREKLNAWYKDLKENLAPLLDINAETLVVLEPEFNNLPPEGETCITEWAEWNGIVIKAIDILRKGAPLAKVGLCPGDWGVYNLEKCMSESARKSDFIAFQAMRASSDPSSDSSTAEYRDVAGSAVKFSAYLQKAFNKPVLWAYLALSSYKNGDPLGWETEQAGIISGIFKKEKELLEKGVFGFLYFSYYDDPSHGTYFFGEAEKYFGLRTSSGKPKKAWQVWKNNSPAE